MTSLLHELGWLLRRGGPRWHRYVEAARERRDTGKGWSDAHVEFLARALGLTKHPIPFGVRCPKCPPPDSSNSYPSARTMLSLPDRYVARCTRCGEEWVKLTERHHLEPKSPVSPLITLQDQA